MAYYPIATSFEARYRLFGQFATAIFNDPLEPEYVGALTEVTGLDSPEIRESAFDLTESDGGDHGYFYLGRRPITLSGIVYGHASVAERDARLDRARRASLALRFDSVLTWKPRSRVENIVSNPRATNNTTSWSTGVANVVNAGATLTRQTGLAPPTGTTGFELATSGSGSSFQGAAYQVTLTAGVTYALSMAYRRTVGTGTGEIIINSVSGLGNNAALAATLTSGSWTVISGTFTPTLTGSYGFAFRQAASNTNASTFQFSDVMISPGTITTYRDGDTAGWYWNGDAGDTSSGDFIEAEVRVRRQQPFREAGNWVKTFQIPLVSESAVIQSRAVKTGVLGVAAENRGNFPAYPIVTIVGPSTNPTISLAGSPFTTTGLTLASGESVEFDFRNHTGVFRIGARAGQSANRYINWATTGWPFFFGNGFSETASISSGGGTGTFTYRDTWA